MADQFPQMTPLVPRQLINGGEVTLRAAAALTLAYVASQAMCCPQAGDVDISLDFTKGSTTGMKFYIEESEDNVTFMPVGYVDGTRTIVIDEIALGAATATFLYRATKRRPWMRVQAKGLTDIAGSSLTIKAKPYFAG